MAGNNDPPSSNSLTSNLTSAASSVGGACSITTSPGTGGGFIRVDVKVKHVSATRRIPLMSVHTKDGFQMVNYCETEKEEFLKQEVMELTELKKMNHEDCDDSKDDDFLLNPEILLIPSQTEKTSSSFHNKYILS
ncbi:uncharacterized protein H6S33_010846 [Morchella sextelata]|uniref:uncharacterized protein n=1 Tax=Morchella sextelata TaxID=1174677 RepID=UPI001D0546D0|nr:uncharacterized protein H6S33_010846 [Morchella sextelata]KAH0611581.1 hypothetical protein H6S33_010846 [Morchella sextelata]